MTYWMHTVRRRSFFNSNRWIDSTAFVFRYFNINCDFFHPNWSRWSTENGMAPNWATWFGGDGESQGRSGRTTQHIGGVATSSTTQTPSRPMRLKFRPSTSLAMDRNPLSSSATPGRIVRSLCFQNALILNKPFGWVRSAFGTKQDISTLSTFLKAPLQLHLI